MKTKIKFIVCLLLAATLLLMPSCFKSKKGSVQHEQFGQYGYKGHYLTSFASEQITFSDAKVIAESTTTGALAGKNVVYMSSASGGQALPASAVEVPEEIVDELLSNYKGVSVVTRYYTEDKKQQQQQTHDIIGNEFKNLLTANEFIPYSRARAKFVIITPSIIDAMEAENKAFHDDTATSRVAPFKNIYSYHKNEQGCLVIQINSFAEIASSTGGGIGSNFIQSNEILYDAEGKISRWQTSLGLNILNPSDGDDLKQGYILEVEFVWLPKT